MKCRPLSHEKAAAGAGATPTSGSSTRMRTGPPAPTWVTVWGPGATANGSSSSDDDGSLRKQLACVPGTAARRSHALHPIYATRCLARTGDLAGLRPGLATPTSAPRCGSPTSPPTSSTNAASAPSRGRRSRSSSTATRPERHPSLLVSKHRDTTPKPVAPEPEEEGQDDGLNGFAVRAVAELAVDAGGGA